jgi:uncharacterized protein with PIN domain
MEDAYWVKVDKSSQQIREVDTIRCEDCGGEMDKVDCTPEERKEYGCGRPYDCCSAAFVCESCHKRIVISLPAPEMDDYE